MSDPSAAYASLPLRVVGRDLRVPLADGGAIPYVHLDYAASAPCLQRVRDDLDALLPWYSSVHRGAGFASAVCTEIYAASRGTVAAFVGARASDHTVFTRNTTDAIHLLASVLPRGTVVFGFASEHHANLLPWRRGAAVTLPLPSSPHEAVRILDRALSRTPGVHRLVAVTGASNVTGEIWPIAALAACAHRHGARILVDAAQLAPHRAIDITAMELDWVALSAHKMYAPFGAGALIGRADWLDDGAPYLAGGGAARRVTGVDIEWSTGPARHEGGTPNVLGAAAFASACRALAGVGMLAVARHEAVLLERAREGLARIPGIESFALWGPSSARIGIVAFNLRGWHHAHLAAVLSAEYGIGVRDGAFCAHSFIDALVGDRRGAVRASFGIGSQADDIDRLVAALVEIAERDPAESDERRQPRSESHAPPDLVRRFAAHGGPHFVGA